jgi:hypothetical protein
MNHESHLDCQLQRQHVAVIACIRLPLLRMLIFPFPLLSCYRTRYAPLSSTPVN